MSSFSLVIASSIGTIVCFALLFLISVVDFSSKWIFFTISILIAGFSSFFALSAFLGIFKFISDLPSTSYLRVMSFGFGVAAVLTSFMRLCSILLFPPIPGHVSHSDASFYFILAMIICTLAVVLFYLSRDYVERLSITKRNIISNDSKAAEVDGAKKDQFMDSATFLPTKLLLSHVWGKLFCLYFSSLQIALVLPNFFYLTRSSSYTEGSSILFSERIFPLFCLFICSIADFTGRLLLKVKAIAQLSDKFWIVLTMVRNIFIGFFLVGNLHPILQPASFKFSLIPHLYSSDLFYLLLMLLYCLTSGAITTAMLMFIPSFFRNPVDRKNITTWMVGIQSFGFLSGTCLSFVLKYLLYSSITETSYQ